MTAGSATSPAAGGRTHSGVLAAGLQEVFTAIVRVQTSRQAATDATVFRTAVKQLLRTAHSHAASAGISNDDIKLALFAAVAFLDEAILNAADPALAGWSRQPLQEELFGGHTGGTAFFDNLRVLLTRQDSEQLADVLEIYRVCLQLGFRGQYGRGGGDELRRWAAACHEKITRIRGGEPVLAPDGPLPSGESIPVAKDPWIRRLTYAMIGLAALAVLLWLAVEVLVLPSWLSDLRGARPA